MANIVTHIALSSMWSLLSLYPVILNIGWQRHLLYPRRTHTSSHIDCLTTFGLWPFQMFSFSVWTIYISSYFAPFLRAKLNFYHEFVGCMVHSEEKSSCRIRMVFQHWYCAALLPHFHCFYLSNTCIHYQHGRQKSTKMTTPAHRSLDHLLDDLKPRCSKTLLWSLRRERGTSSTWLRTCWHSAGQRCWRC